MDKFLRARAAHREEMASEGRTLVSCSWCNYIGKHRTSWLHTYADDTAWTRWARPGRHRR